MEEMIRPVDKNAKCWPRPSNRPWQPPILPVLLPCSLAPHLGLKGHQAYVLNVEKMGTGLGCVLTLILRPCLKWFDFTHMPTVTQVKYLLVLVDTMSGWI